MSRALNWCGVLLGSAMLVCAARAAKAGEAQPASPDKSDAEADSEEGNGDPSAIGVPIEVASKAQKEVARKQLQLGIDLLDAGKFAQSLEVLRMSYQRVASPNTRLMIARVLEKLNRYPEAYNELQLALGEARALARGASKYDESVEAIEAELAVVRPKVALVTLDLGVQVSSGGQVVEPSRWGEPLVLPAGETVFELKLANGQTKTASAKVAGGEDLKVPLMLEAPNEQEASGPREPVARNVVAQPLPSNAVSRNTLGWVGVGIAGVGAVGFVTFGLLDKARYDRLEAQCADSTCPSSLRDEAETGRMYQSLANVGLGVGAVGMLTAAYFFLTADEARPQLDTKRHTARSAPKRSPTLALARKFDAHSPYIVLGTNSVTLTGSF